MPASLLYKWVAAPVPPPPPLSPPAVYSADDIANWDVQINGVFVDATEPPDGDDHLLFVGSASNLNCTIPATGGSMGGGLPGSPPPPAGPPLPRAFASVTQTDGVAGIVDFQCSAFVGVMVLNGAAGSGIAQNAPYQYTQNQTGGHISVTQTFTWNAGSINSGPLAPKMAYFNLTAGATGTATPTEENATEMGVVKLGSTFSLMGNEDGTQGADFTINEGRYQINCALAFHVLAGQLAIAAPVPKPARLNGKIELTQDGVTEDKTDAAADEGIVVVRSKGVAKIENAQQGAGGVPSEVLFGGKKPKLTNMGTVLLKDGITLHFQPTGNNTGAGGGLVQQNEPVVVFNPFPAVVWVKAQRFAIEAGSSVVCDKETSVALNGYGRLELIERKNSDGIAYTTQDPITISTQGRHQRPLAQQERPAPPPGRYGAPAFGDYRGVRFRRRHLALRQADRHRDQRHHHRHQADQVHYGREPRGGLFSPSEAGQAFGHSYTLIHSDYVDPLGVKPAINMLPACQVPDPNAADCPAINLTADNKNIRMETPAG